MYELNETLGKHTGYCIDLLDELAALMKLEYELYLAPDKKFGSMNDQGVSFENNTSGVHIRGNPAMCRSCHAC